MNSIYGQNDNANVHAGMMPYAAPMLPAGIGGDSLFQIAWRGKWLILLSLIASLGGAYAYYRTLGYRTLGPQYVSASRVLVSIPKSPRQQDPGGLEWGVNLQTQTSLICSPTIINPALSDPSMIVVSANLGDGLNDLVRTLSAKVGKDDIITVTASSVDPNSAAVFVNAVVRAFIQWHKDNSVDLTDQRLKDLEAQRKNLTMGLQRKRDEKLTFEQRNPEIVESTRGGVVAKALDLMTQDSVSARMEVARCEALCTTLKQIESDPNRVREYLLNQQNAIGMTVDDGEWKRLEDGLYETRMQLQQMEAGGTVQKYQITLMRTRVAQLVKDVQDAAKRFVQKYVALADVLRATAVDRRKKCEQQYEDEVTKIQKQGDKYAEYARLISECDIIERLLDGVVEAISKMPPRETIQGAVSVYVLNTASPAEKPTSQMARVMGIGLVLGLMMGGGLAFLRDWRDQRVRSADEITAILGVPILGAVPTIPRRGIIQRGPRSRLATHTREFEAYRSIRTALFFGTGRDEAKTLLVTSPGPLEGKTTLVSNLGIAMARTGQKTLIIDADLRKPMQHRVFAKKGHGKGLVDVLAGTATLEEAIRPTDVEGLDVLESGPIVPNPSELLGSEAFWGIFEQLKGRYDRILVDSPPVGIVADAQILASRCGLTLLVLRAQRSSRLVTQRARDALSTVSARVIGAVVNDVPKGDTRYSHYGSGAYSYYYGGRESDGRKAGHKALPSDVSPQDGNESSPTDKLE
ncbi:MAG: polysaccharide biosynthesis tyrosine autokinase [Phycisphaerales bacterium]